MTEAVRLVSTDATEPAFVPDPSVVGATMVGGRQVLYLPGYSSVDQRKLSIFGRFLVWLGDHPNIVIATVVHVVLFVGLYSLVVQEEKAKAKEKAIEIAISMEDSFHENREDEPDASSGSESLPERPVPVAGTANDADAATNTGGQTTAPEPEDWPIPSDTGAARVRAQALRSGISGSGEGVPGTGATGAGSTAAGMTSMRNANGRAAGVATNGGSAASENAVDAGLKWLAAHVHLEDHQDSSSGRVIRLGWWRPKEFPRDARDLETGERVRYPGQWPSGEVGMERYTAGVTGLCVLPFLGAGHTPQEGRYAYLVAAVMNWLLREQDRYGSFDRGDMYNHAIATSAIAECLVLTGDEALRHPLQRAIDYMLAKQHDNGGWDYTYNPVAPRNDTSITGWCQMALKGAHAAGIEIPRTAWLRLIHHFRRMATQDGYTWYADLNGDDDLRQGNAMVATSIFCRLGLGASTDDPLMRKQMSLLLSELPDPDRLKSSSNLRRRTETERLDQSYYTWYIGTLAAFFHGGHEWNRWNGVMRETAIALQNRNGQLRGSWDGLDKWSWAGGRLYATAMMVLTLETYYRYVPDYFLADARRLESYHDTRRLYAILGAERQNDKVTAANR